jgi:NAD-dependent deacetylase
MDLLAKLTCPKCESPTRPHVLWFDETYNEPFYRFESSLETAANTDLLLVVGTSGSTNLPNYVVQMVIQKGGLVFDINIEANTFGELAIQNKGFSLTGQSGQILPELVAAL